MAYRFKIFATALILAVLAVPVQAKESAKPSEDQGREELEQKLTAARERLEEAAREVAELSGKLTGPIAHDYFIAGRKSGGSMLGIGMGPQDKDGVVVESLM